MSYMDEPGTLDLTVNQHGTATRRVLELQSIEPKKNESEVTNFLCKFKQI